MAKYQIPHKTFMQRLISCIPGSKLDSGDGLIIPHIKVAIVIEDWGPNNCDRFHMFHYTEAGLDRKFLSSSSIPTNSSDPVEYVAAMCLPTLVEEYYGRYMDDIDVPEICLRYWNKILLDDSAEALFRPKTR